MKERLIVLRDKIDALSVRERVMLFAGVAGLLVFLFYSMVLTPLFKREQALRAQIVQQNNHITGIDAEIIAAVQAHAVDPDAVNRMRLGSIQSEAMALAESLRTQQSGLLAPQQVAPLLGTMLRTNARLRLVGLRTLPVSPMNGSADAAPGPATPGRPPELVRQMEQIQQLGPGQPVQAQATQAGPATPLLYRHGVEVSVRGNYLDMITYMDALESMSTKLIWGKAELSVEDYPNSRLTLTVYTLSLDKKWMKL